MTSSHTVDGAAGRRAVLPLAGYALTAAHGRAAETTAIHLRALGAHLAPPRQLRWRDDDPRGDDAGRVMLSRDGNAELDCRIAWADPVDLPLADELDVQAACGIAHVHGRRHGAPTPLGIDVATTAAGALAATGMLAALYGNERGVANRCVRTSVARAALLTISQYLAAATASDDLDPTDTPTDVTTAAGAGFVIGGDTTSTDPPFTAADGTRFELEALDAASWQNFWTELAAPPTAVASGWRPFQQRYATATCVLPIGLGRTASRHGFGEIALAARRAGVSVVQVRDAVSRTADERRTGSQVMSGVAGDVPWRLAPLAGSIFAGAVAPAAAPRDDAPLSGLVVVESTRRVQGPLAGHLLWLLGARVIRVEPPGGDPLRGVPPTAGGCSARFLALNHGKEVVEADLGTEDGRQALREMVARADVFVHNWAPGKAEAWDLNAEALAAVRPGLVYAEASGWGRETAANSVTAAANAPHPPLGTDFMVQAGSGLAALLARPNEPATPSLMTLTDVVGGIVCAEGVLAGVLTRLRTGAAQRVDTSLLSAACLLGAGAARRSDRAPGSWPPAGIPLHADLSALAADQRFARALRREACVLVETPWEFVP